MKKTMKLALAIGIVAVIFLEIAVEKISSPSGQTQTTTVSNNQPSPAFLQGTKFAPEGLTIVDNTFVFDSKSVDVNGDGTVDDVVLYGEKQADSPFVQNIGVAVKNGSSGKFSMASIGELNVGYQPKLFIGSFISTKNNDILVSFATGGSGGVTQYSLLTDKDNRLTSLVPQKELNKGLELETKCLPDFNMKVTDKNTGYTSMIDLHKGLAEYKRLGIYNQNGELLKDPMVLIDGFGVLKPEINGNGIYELHGIQRMSVGYHANSVANVESVWTVSNDQLKLLSENIKVIQI